MQGWAVPKAENPVLQSLASFLGLPMTVGWRTPGRVWDSCFVTKGFFKIGHPDTIGILCVLNVLETLA